MSTYLKNGTKCRSEVSLNREVYEEFKRLPMSTLLGELVRARLRLPPARPTNEPAPGSEGHGGAA